MKRINLLPQEERAKASRERGLIYALLMLVGLVVVLGLVYVYQNSQVSDRQAEVDQLQAQASSLQAQAAELRPFQELQSQRTALQQTARSIYDARVYWSSFLEELSLVIPVSCRLESITCTVPPAMQPGAAPVAGDAQQTAEPVDVALVGQAFSYAGTEQAHREVANLMTRLGLVPMLENIRLGNTAAEQQAVSGDTENLDPRLKVVLFTVNANLRPYTTPPPVSSASSEAAQ